MAGFLQVEIDWVLDEKKGYKILTNSWHGIPSNYHDLEFAMTNGDVNSELIFSEGRYELRKIVDMQQFLLDESAQSQIDRKSDFGGSIRVIDVNAIGSSHRDIPLNEMTPSTSKVTRFFEDWQASSAGANRIYEFWGFYANTNEYRISEGERVEYYFTPTWTIKGDIPEVKVEGADNIYSLMDKLTKFDEFIGHSFAWFFFMLHGNRIRSEVASVVAENVKSDHISLPSNDEKVLLNWHYDFYDF